MDKVYGIFVPTSVFEQEELKMLSAAAFFTDKEERDIAFSRMGSDEQQLARKFELEKAAYDQFDADAH